MGLFPSFANAQVRQFQLSNILQRPTKGDRPRKLDRLFRASEICLFAGTLLDASSTAAVLDHPRVAYRADHSVLGRFNGEEIGWAGPIVGRRNTSGVVAANVALNIGVDLVARALYRQGGRWQRLAAIFLVSAKAEGSLTAGAGNIRFGSGINERLRASTGYGGSFSWAN